MLTDTFFSFSRFKNFYHKEMVENWKSNLLRFTMMYGVMAAIFVWNGYFSYENPNSYHMQKYPDIDPAWSFALQSFTTFLFTFGLLSASFTMEKMKLKTNRIHVLMTPATSFEKFFTWWFTSTVLYLVAFIIAFKLADYTRVLVHLHARDEFPMMAPIDLSLLLGHKLSPFSDVQNIIWCALTYFFAQSCFTLGSAIWPKNSFIKTITAGIIIAISYGLIITGFVKMMRQEKLGSFPDISEETTIILGSTIAICFTLGNWVLAYFRFKESEIINRM